LLTDKLSVSATTFVAIVTVLQPAVSTANDILSLAGPHSLARARCNFRERQFSAPGFGPHSLARATCTGKALKRRKELYEAMHPETKRGATLKQGPKRQNVATEIPSFAADTAAKTGTSRRTVEPRTPSPVRRNAPARLKGRVDRERVDERPGASWNVQPAGGEISKIWEFGPHVDMAGRFG
jgi:hypothetical protein